MALFTSDRISQASGSAGGTTFSRNRFGMYFRKRAVPVNPRSISQTTVRSFFGSASSSWRGLDPSVMVQWTDYANATPWLNKLGQAVTLTGQQMWCALNTLGKRLGLTADPDPPVTPGLCGLVVTGASIDSGTSHVLVTLAPTGNTWQDGATSRIGAFIGRPVSDGVRFYNGPFDLFGAIPRGTATLTTATLTNVGAVLTPGEARFLRIRAIDTEARPSNEAILGPITVG